MAEGDIMGSTGTVPPPGAILCRVIFDSIIRVFTVFGPWHQAIHQILLIVDGQFNNLAHVRVEELFKFLCAFLVT